MAAKPRPAQLDSPRVKSVMRRVARAHVWLYRRTGGRIGGKYRLYSGLRKPVPTLLLDHRGRSSGRAFTTPLLYLVDGADVVVVASQGGMAEHPQWYRNLQASPDTTVQIRSGVRRVRARTATPDERAALWPRLVDLYAEFESYQAWTEREIPVVVLEPR